MDGISQHEYAPACRGQEGFLWEPGDLSVTHRERRNFARRNTMCRRCWAGDVRRKRARVREAALVPDALFVGRDPPEGSEIPTQRALLALEARNKTGP